MRANLYSSYESIAPRQQARQIQLNSNSAGTPRCHHHLSHPLLSAESQGGTVRVEDVRRPFGPVPGCKRDSISVRARNLLEGEHDCVSSDGRSDSARPRKPPSRSLSMATSTQVSVLVTLFQPYALTSWKCPAPLSLG